MTRLKETKSHNGDYAINLATQLPRLFTVVNIPAGKVMFSDESYSACNRVLKMVPQEIRHNFTVWRYDPHDYHPIVVSKAPTTKRVGP